MAVDLASRFNRDWWIEEEGVFADSPDRQKRPILEGHWVVAVPLEVGIAEKDKAERVLVRLEEEWVSEWGLVHTRNREPRFEPFQREFPLNIIRFRLQTA